MGECFKCESSGRMGGKMYKELCKMLQKANLNEIVLLLDRDKSFVVMSEEKYKELKRKAINE